MFGVASLTLGADTDWRDVESRMQYAWYTEDARDLVTAGDRVTALSSAEPLRNYYLALTHLHEAQLAVAAAARSEGAVRRSAISARISSATRSTRRP